MHMSGTASLVIGRSQYEKQSNHSKTNNGLGSTYGDNCENNLKPYKSVLYDKDAVDNPVEKDE